MLLYLARDASKSDIGRKHQTPTVLLLDCMLTLPPSPAPGHRHTNTMSNKETSNTKNETPEGFSTPWPRFTVERGW